MSPRPATFFLGPNPLRDPSLCQYFSWCSPAKKIKLCHMVFFGFISHSLLSCAYQNWYNFDTFPISSSTCILYSKTSKTQVPGSSVMRTVRRILMSRQLGTFFWAPHPSSDDSFCHTFWPRPTLRPTMDSWMVISTLIQMLQD